MSTNSTPKTRSFFTDRGIEILTGVLLAVVAVATAWSVYQATRWAGVQSLRMSSASARRIEATQASTLAGQQTQVDIGLFTNWVNAYIEENQELAEFYQHRFRAEFVPAFDAWVATKPRSNPDAPSSPFAMPQYQLAAQQESDELTAQADALVVEGQAALATNNAYVLTTVFLASVLFFATLSMRLYWRGVKLAVLILAIVMLLVSIGRLISLPVY